MWDPKKTGNPMHSGEAGVRNGDRPGDFPPESQIPDPDLRGACRPLDGAARPPDPPPTDVKGLKWKIWLFNESANSAGGIYLFEDQASLDAYLEGDIVRMMKNSPALRT